MPNNRTPILPPYTTFVRNLRTRLFSTSSHIPCWAVAPTKIKTIDHARRYPLIEAQFNNAAHQPYIHDIVVVVIHGAKTSVFRIYLQRGKGLPSNGCNDTIVGDVVMLRVAAGDNTYNTVVNMRVTDGKIANYVFKESLTRIAKFQSPARTQLPKKLVFRRARAFPGKP
ncbi:hypothetical protein B0H16DRAFT_1741770 [Mycena metata]|uniref:Uncharacterized protein n=1 Tax=Mycena metata TaxID=1033252 RepID=A0AAD7H9E2_9AGAR|nr:hypothetical protein B0H16DRAFT_1741770 [Mycena metata]